MGERSEERFLETDLDAVVRAASEAQHPLSVDSTRPRWPIRYEATCRELGGSSVCLARLDYEAAYRVDGEPIRTHYHLQLPLSGRSRVTHDGAVLELSGGGRGLLLSPERPTSWRSLGGFEEVSLNLDRPAVERRLEVLTGEPLESAIAFEPLLDLSSATGRELSRLVGLLARVHADEAPGLVSRVVDLLLLSHPHDDSGLLERTAGVGSARLVRRAEELIEARAAEDLRIGDVAAALGVSLRTLQRSFLRHRDCSPKRYLTKLRLRRARELLVEGGTSVTFAAMRAGCTHLGQFSCDYRREFGERPSETLRRTRRAVAFPIALPPRIGGP